MREEKKTREQRKREKNKEKSGAAGRREWVA
jgi:hypothetical protein